MYGLLTVAGAARGSIVENSVGLYIDEALQSYHLSIPGTERCGRSDHGGPPAEQGPVRNPRLPPRLGNHPTFSSGVIHQYPSEC